MGRCHNLGERDTWTEIWKTTWHYLGKMQKKMFQKVETVPYEAWSEAPTERDEVGDVVRC